MAKLQSMRVEVILVVGRGLGTIISELPKWLEKTAAIVKIGHLVEDDTQLD